ncbi:MAG: hypothetical protein IT204_23825 [Fimbriimonadaceae bacterium]|nr:hypothetical protein [Fimbriimonadaceae bacterium]
MRHGGQRQRVVAVGWLLAVLWTSGAHGAAKIQVQPLRAQIEARAGERFAFAISIRNDAATEPVQLGVTPVDVVQDGDSREHYLPVGETAYSCGAWVEVPAEPLSIGPGESQTIQVKGRVPTGAKGSYHAALMLRALQVAPKDGPPRIVMAVAYAFPLSILVAGTGEASIAISQLDLQLDPDAAPGQRLGLLRLGLRNHGNLAATVRGRIFLRAVTTNETALQLPYGLPSGRKVLPATEVLDTLAWPGLPAAGQYILEARIAYGTPERQALASRRLDVGADGRITVSGELDSRAQQAVLRLEPTRLQIERRSNDTTAVRQVVLRNQGTVPCRVELRLTAYAETPEGEPLEVPQPAEEQPRLRPGTHNLAAGASAAVTVELPAVPGADATREQYWLLQARGYPTSGRGNVLCTGEALVVAANRRAVQPARPALQQVAVTVGRQLTLLRLLVANDGGTALPVAGSLQVMQADQPGSARRVPLTTQPALTILAGGQRWLEVAVPQALERRAWQCTLTLDLGGGRSSESTFEVQPPTANGGAAP